MKKNSSKTDSGRESPSQLIDARISELNDWRGEILARVRKLILQADREVVEEWKWGVPVWSHYGIICTGESYKNVVKLTFPKGASLEDPAGLFNSSLEGNARRAIDFHEGDKLDSKGLKSLIRAAVEMNSSLASQKGAKKVKPKGGSMGLEKPSKKPAMKRASGKPKLLSGGNPQIAKEEGDAPVQAYIAAMPGWKREIGKRLDEIIVRNVPKVRKAVKWNSPFYGLEGEGWFLSFHCFTKYVKVAFFKGAALRPLPPGVSKQAEVRYLDIHEADPIDEKQLAAWIKQAAKLPGWLA